MNLRPIIFMDPAIDKEDIPQPGDLYRVVEVVDGFDVHWGPCLLIELTRMTQEGENSEKDGDDA